MGTALRGPENQPLGAPRDPHLSHLPPAQPASTEPDARPLGDLPALRRRDRLAPAHTDRRARPHRRDRKSTRLNSSHLVISYAVFCLKKKKKNNNPIHHTSPSSHKRRHQHASRRDNVHH